MAASGSAGLSYVQSSPPDAILLDMRLPDLPGLEVYQRLRRIDAGIPVVFLTTDKTADIAIEAMKHGAFDCLFKPLDSMHVRRVIESALEVTRQARARVMIPQTPTDLDLDGEILGACPAMCEVYKAIGRVASQEVTVLIAGETGTGKELVARAIHRHGSRSKAPFMALNCAAIPEQLLESELFGHEKGAFTGADRRRIGKFEQCNNGTILLDEIGDMPLSLQAKILRVLQEQSFERVGGNETVRTNVRIIAASHRDLKALSAQGKFRADLYYRLSVFTIHLPPLRERGDDLSILAHYYLRRFGRELGKEILTIDSHALSRLRAYPWPGNIRELQSVMKQALLQARGSALLSSFLPELSADASDHAASGSSDFEVESFIRRRLQTGARDLYADAHACLDRLLLTRVLDYTGGSQRKAVRLLGIARQTLRTKLRDLELPLTQLVEAEDNEPSAVF
jgi:two-component system nitrogen regulation response regulator GlnG